MSVPALQIYSCGPDVEIRTTVDGETHLTLITPREAYTLATFAEWLLDERDAEMPSTFANLPDHVAVEATSEPCHDCPVPHERPVLLFSVAVGEALEDVRVVEMSHPIDLHNLPVFLITAAVLANAYEEPTHV